MEIIQVPFDRDEFERQWQQHMAEERQLADDFLQGKFADSLQPEDARGGYLHDLIGETDTDLVLSELERLNVAVIAWIASHNLGDALRQVRSGGHLALGNVGFEFESDFFRLASYDWSDDEDEDGNPIHRHDFVCKPSGTYLDWYKWAHRDDWASPGLAAAFTAVQEKKVSISAWWERVIDGCIDSLILTDVAHWRKVTSCGWRHLDEDAIPHRMVKVDATVRSNQVDSVTLSHPTEGYVGFKNDWRRAGLPNDIVDATDEYPEIAKALAEKAENSLRRPLGLSLSLDGIECPDDIGYLVVGRKVFCRFVLDEPVRRFPTGLANLLDALDDEDEDDDDVDDELDYDAIDSITAALEGDGDSE